MNKNNIFLANYIFISIFISSILLMSFMTSAFAQYSVGVTAGDWAGYGDISFEFASNMTGYEEPPSGLNMSWMDMEILNVQNSNVTLRSTAIYKNGTEQTDVVWGNITSGEGNLSVSIIPSNLDAGDEIPANLTYFTEPPLRLTINGTITKSFAGSNREVNYVNIASPIMIGNVTYGSVIMSFCWDKKTGIMCEEQYSYSMAYTINSTCYYYNMSMLWRLTATNMWPAIFTVQDGYVFNVTMISNSTISDFSFNEPLKQISFNVTGPSNKAGYCSVSIPKGLLWGDFSVSKDGIPLVRDVDYTQTHNGTHYNFHMDYAHTTHVLIIQATEVIPEFPAFAILTTLIAILLITLIFKSKKEWP